jgi:hypothetical protein
MALDLFVPVWDNCSRARRHSCPKRAQTPQLAKVNAGTDGFSTRLGQVRLGAQSNLSQTEQFVANPPRQTSGSLTQSAEGMAFPPVWDKVACARGAIGPKRRTLRDATRAQTRGSHGI